MLAARADGPRAAPSRAERRRARRHAAHSRAGAGGRDDEVRGAPRPSTIRIRTRPDRPELRERDLRAAPPRRASPLIPTCAASLEHGTAAQSLPERSYGCTSSIFASALPRANVSATTSPAATWRASTTIVPSAAATIA